MEEEIIVSGYCRSLDKSRMVLIEDGEPDCSYTACPHFVTCRIAKEIREILQS